MERGNFLEVINAFAILDAVLMQQVSLFVSLLPKTPKWYHGKFKMTYRNVYLSLYDQKQRTRFQIAAQLLQMRSLIGSLIEKFYYFNCAM